MARDLQQRLSERMATRMNMLKLLQEVRGFAQFTTRPTESRPPGPLLLQFRGPRQRNPPVKRARLIRIDMQEAPDIPQSVRIIHLQKRAPGSRQPN